MLRRRLRAVVTLRLRAEMLGERSEVRSGSEE